MGLVGIGGIAVAEDADGVPMGGGEGEGVGGEEGEEAEAAGHPGQNPSFRALLPRGGGSAPGGQKGCWRDKRLLGGNSPPPRFPPINHCSAEVIVQNVKFRWGRGGVLELGERLLAASRLTS